MDNNKMNRITEDLKLFKEMTGTKRDRDTSRVEEDGDFSPVDILMEASGMLLETSILIAKAAFMTAMNEEEDDPGIIVLVAKPDGDFVIMNTEELAGQLAGLFDRKAQTLEMLPVPGADDLYYTIPNKGTRKIDGKLFVTEPVIICGINEDAGEMVSPDVQQLYIAARFFEHARTTITTNGGKTIPAFCFE